MKNILKVAVVSFTYLLFSCEDYLERNPLDDITEVEFYKTAQDLETAVNGFYNDLPLQRWQGAGNGFAGIPDNNSDLLIGEFATNRFLGLYTTPTDATNAIWSWDEVREVNYYLSQVDRAEGDEAELNQYIGEGYFFRAYYYFDLLKDYGDLPIIDTYITDTDEEYLYKARDPRNEVVDFILSDLDTAIGLLGSFPNVAEQRISKEAALFLKARIALYEGTWEKYHSGTVFGVEGSDGSSYLQIAADAAKEVMDSGIFALHDDYGSLFNQTDLSGNTEMLLWREYDYIGLNIGNDLQIGWPNKSSYTRFAVRSYLCTDGDPISVSPLYVGDQDLSTLENNRDPRLAATIMVPGDVVRIDSDGTETLFAAPVITGQNAASTGYESQKYRNPNVEPSSNEFSRNTAKIIMRYAELLLIYAEAKGELGTITQSDLDISVNLLRDRVGMPHMVLSGITTDPEWPNYGYALSDVLYEIRRERSVELMAEGFRLDDLLRWRAHELINSGLPKGAYFYDGIIETMADESEVYLDAEDYLDPFQSDGAYNFDPDKAYLNAIPSNEIILNPNLTQNPGW
ncbi:RagB/SusD family nutrient uptake outer membrane protein [Pseudozobellia thermophila]|uniref:Starch-binding associating with outer membrane n=1 Tax=Pseudozobellia thermophila TaxID=192903 RepID=A0A1M6DAX6_9FLAO|nr:RagB/SusD family nutrient uptake outer membrane protein [Pseudozobellia thermophila]SHI70261.1 Starch-binding associating with outer membrane [Pseudozobellia thermophila]